MSNHENSAPKQDVYRRGASSAHDLNQEKVTNRCHSADSRSEERISRVSNRCREPWAALSEVVNGKRLRCQAGFEAFCGICAIPAVARPWGSRSKLAMPE